MNYAAFKAINGPSGSAWLDAVMKFMATDGLFLIAAGAFVLLVSHWRRREFTGTYKLVVASVIAAVADLVLGALYDERRPFVAHRSAHLLIKHARDNSFPSDHATAALTIAGATAVFVHRRWALILVAGAIWIGVSRIFVGAHYPLDVVASAVIATAAVAATWAAFRTVHIRSGAPTHRRLNTRDCS